MPKVIDINKYRERKKTSKINLCTSERVKERIFVAEAVEKMIKEVLLPRCPHIIYEIIYSKSMYRKLGTCTGKTKGKRKYITFKFSLPYLKACLRTDNMDDFWDTVLHEIGHAIVYYAYGAGHGHDAVWKDIMVMLGGRPEKSTNAYFFTPYRYIYKCPYCGKETKTLKKYKKGVACGVCCREYNGGSYTTDYILDLVRDEGKIIL